jgi:hypothetical protein
VKPVAYFCPCVGGRVPLDHWSAFKCKDLPMPLGWILGITKGLDDPAHSGGNITATRILDCPRKVLIEDFVRPRLEDLNFGLVFDPRRMNSARFGTVLHADIAANMPPGAYQEVRFPLEGQPPVMLDFGEGVVQSISGAVDYLSPDTIILEDYKTHSETAHKFKWNRKAAEPELRAQFSIYKALIEKCIEGAKVTKMMVWHGAQTSAKHPAPPWFKLEVPPMAIEDIGSIRPVGALVNVRSIIKMLQWGLGEIRAIGAPPDSVEWYQEFDAIINRLPMVGETMFNGEKCPTYCGSAQPYCFRVAGRAEVL